MMYGVVGYSCDHSRMVCDSNTHVYAKCPQGKYWCERAHSDATTYDKNFIFTAFVNIVYVCEYVVR